MPSNAPFNVQTIQNATVIEFTISSLMEPLELEMIGEALYRLVDEQDKRILILDFERVEFLSSQAIGILLALHKKLRTLRGSKFILCGVGERLRELLRITQLDRLLTIKPTQREAIKSIS